MQATVPDENIKQRVTLETYEKSARIRRILRFLPGGWKEHEFQEILELDGDINYQLPDSGDTALHLTVKALGPVSRKKRALNQLIIGGADPTIANRQGQTVVHLAVDDFKKFVYYLKNFHKSPYAADILPIVHLTNGITTNFMDVHGFSHFHAACMIDNAEIVEFFLSNGISVDEAVNVDSPDFPGYTSLHFAVEYGSPDLVDKLLDHGANLSKDSRGMTPLHLLIRRNMEIIQHASLYRIPVCNCPQDGIGVNEETVLAEMEANEKMIGSIVSKRSKTTMAGLDLLPFYVMRTLKGASFKWTQNDVNECIPMDSTCWPGYSALHFAARFDIDTVKLLIENGADIEAKDADGVTPFDLCVGRYSAEDVHFIISSHGLWKNILLTDGKTKLSDLVFAMRDPKVFTEFFAERDNNDTSIPRDSPLWPGFTVLHLAVTLSRKRMHDHIGWYAKLFGHHCKIQANELVEACLRLGADVTARDSNGSTPIHLAFRRMDLDCLYVLQEHYDGKFNPTDVDNLSLLHIACAVENENLAKRLVASGADVNAVVSSSFQWDPELRYFHELSSSDEHLMVWPGSTALHVAAEMNNRAISELLLTANADIDARDAYGFTAVHRLLVDHESSYDDPTMFDDLLSRFVTRDCVVDGLSYLHVAANREYPKLLEKLLSLGADVNSAVVARERVTAKFSHGCLCRKRKTKFSYYLSHFEGDTPLHLAFRYANPRGDLPRRLVSGGADVFAKNSRDVSPIFAILNHDELTQHYLSVMSENDEKRLSNELGVTRLHMACRLRDVEMIRECLKKGADANARVRDDSPIWPGRTPLHIVADSSYDSCDFYVKRRARKRERTLCGMARALLKAGADVTIAGSKGRTPLTMDISGNLRRDRWCHPHMDVLWGASKTSNVNPVSDEGISHFHLACLLKDAASVEKYLKLGVDPNQSVDLLSDDYPGYTPLHFAVLCDSHRLVRSDLPPLRVINLLLKYGAKVDAMNAYNDTPLHLAAEYPSPAALPYKRLFWAGADPEAKNSNGKAPTPNLMFNVEKGEVRRLLSSCIRYGRGCLLDKLVSQFACYNRYFRRVLLYFHELANVEKK